jgi:hypothetical protein
VSKINSKYLNNRSQKIVEEYFQSTEKIIWHFYPLSRVRLKKYEDKQNKIKQQKSKFMPQFTQGTWKGCTYFGKK